MPNIEIPDIIKSTSDAAQDNLPATMHQTDGVLSTVVGFFNNVVLYPVKKANLMFRYKLEAFEDDLKEKTKDIPAENLQIPSTMIAGPTLEALRYTYDEAELREMYENLLASAMDNRIATYAHPAFVDTIKQMNPLDAQVMECLAKHVQLRCGKIVFKIKNTTQIYTEGMPNYFVLELLGLGEAFNISASIHNLHRLGLIDIYDMGIFNADYEELKNHSYVIARALEFEKIGDDLSVELDKQTIRLNDFGNRFVKVCLRSDK